MNTTQDLSYPSFHPFPQPIHLPEVTSKEVSITNLYRLLKFKKSENKVYE